MDVPQAEFTYDAIGNPLIYRGKTMTWTRGRNLAEYSGNTYDYNASGIRTTKIENGIQTTYYLDGNKIIAEERKYPNTSNIIDTVYYHYGIDGIAGFEYNGNNYTFRKNSQGDVTHIYTADGELLVQYAYDAWGNCQAYAKKGYEELAERNPFRYRSYYYDTETKLYYLNSRYYDPELGRFINADDISYLDPETINGLNLYAYCCNNPVMLSDSTGTSWLSDLWNNATGWINNNIISPVASFLSDPTAQKGLMIATSVLAILGGPAVAIGNAIIGAGLIGFGVGSLIGGFCNESLGGSFASGWSVGGIATGAASALMSIVAPIIFAASFSLGIPSLTMSGGSMAYSIAMVTVSGAQIAGAAALGALILFARTRKSNGYFGEKYSHDHEPNHIHFKGPHTDSRFTPDGKMLYGDKPLSPQARKALDKLWEEILKKLFGIL